MNPYTGIIGLAQVIIPILTSLPLVVVSFGFEVLEKRLKRFYYLLITYAFIVTLLGFVEIMDDSIPPRIRSIGLIALTVLTIFNFLVLFQMREWTLQELRHRTKRSKDNLSSKPKSVISSRHVGSDNYPKRRALRINTRKN